MWRLTAAAMACRSSASLPGLRQDLADLAGELPPWHLAAWTYLESATPYGPPFTGRQYTNDEVYLSSCKQNELRHWQEKAEGIIRYVRMRRDSARQQLEQLRKTTPRATDSASFPATMEPLPAA